MVQYRYMYTCTCMQKKLAEFNLEAFHPPAQYYSPPNFPALQYYVSIGIITSQLDNNINHVQNHDVN